MRALALLVTTALSVPCRIAAADLASPIPRDGAGPRVVVVRGPPGGEETLLALYRDGRLLYDANPGRVPVEQYLEARLSTAEAAQLVTTLRRTGPRRPRRADDNRICVVFFDGAEPSRSCFPVGAFHPLHAWLQAPVADTTRATPFVPPTVLVHLRPYDHPRCVPPSDQSVVWPAVWPLPPQLAKRGQGDVALPGAAIPVLRFIGTHPPDPCAWVVRVGDYRFLHWWEVRLPEDRLWLGR